MCLSHPAQRDGAGHRRAGRRDPLAVLSASWFTGIGWTRIGAALGVSKQAAWERFSAED
jgi:hypothetical protein